MSARSSRCSSRSSFIYRASPNHSPNKILSLDNEVDGEDVYSEAESSSSGDDRYLETRLSDIETPSSFATGRLALALIATRTDGPGAVGNLNGDDEDTQRGIDEFRTMRSEEHSTSPPRLALEDPESNLTEEQIRIRRELAEIRRLDKILGKKTRMATRVKRERIALQRQIMNDVEEMTSSQSDRSKEEYHNTKKYLALVMSDLPSGNRDVTPQMEFQPVFQTQPDLEDDFIPSRDSPGGEKNNQKSFGSKSKRETGRAPKSSDRSASEQSQGGRSTSSSSTQKTNKTGKSFISRNKKLAADAANVTPMTPEERSQLDKLLKDIDKDEEIINAEQVFCAAGAALSYGMSGEDVQAIQEIDYKLKNYISLDKYREICCGTPRSDCTPGTAGSGSTSSKGDELIRETREERISQIRLAHIEEKLRRLKNSETNELADDVSPLPAYALKRILNDIRSTDRQQDALLPKPSSSQLRALLQESRPGTSYEDWHHVQSDTNPMRPASKLQQLSLVDPVTMALEADVDGETNSLAITASYEFPAVERTVALARDAAELESRSDQLLAKLNSLPLLSEEQLEQLYGTGEENQSQGRITCDQMEQNDRLFQLDNDMAHLREKLASLQSLRDDMH